MFERLVLLALVVAVTPLEAEAQDWRNVTSFRQRAEESQLDVHVRYGAGMLSIAPGGQGELYRTDIRYDADAFNPVTDYHEGRLDVGVEGRGRGINVRNTGSGVMKLALSPDVPLDLDLEFGAVEANLELGGLRLSRLDIQTGASDTKIDFSEPNRTACESLRIQMGAAALEARGIANANCARVRTKGGMGDLTLDFSGHWQRDLDAEITVALGNVTLRIPENIGVRVRKDTFLADFNGRRFHKVDGSHYSDNWDRAEHRLTIQVNGAFGTIDVRWLQPAVAAP